ncbi:hypothetical protein E2P81_ATG11559 [Venturia nashicola]|uniref:Uncharacterized protein n=1 Tax=Venturia nashicola TaxID=86259 RepID=A0A4Z1P4P5_9PEZI|nr:hypothetical protein E6O75_ATG11252 [Venturia nashicola]TLD35440.1 hypothetical protein E2P81_ATG11559 [Venturia nashicola]
MRIPTTLALVILPFVITAQQHRGWLFETSSGRAQGVGSRSCQRFYMKKAEEWTMKLDPAKRSKKVRSASPEPQGGWGDAGWGNGNAPPTSTPQDGGGWGVSPIPSSGGTWSPTAPDSNGWGSSPQLPPSNNGGGYQPWTPPPQVQPSPNRQPPPLPQNPNKPWPPKESKGGEWNGPKAPPSNSNCPSQSNGGRPPQNNGGQWNGPTVPPRPAHAAKCCVRIYTDDDCKDNFDEGCAVDKNDGKFDKGKANKDAESFNVICT